MKTRERLKRLKSSGSYPERLEIAEDALPGTPFDELFSTAAESWVESWIDDPEARKNWGWRKEKVFCPLTKYWLSINRVSEREFGRKLLKTVHPSRRKQAATENARVEKFAKEDRENFYKRLGVELTNILVCERSQVLRDLADAIDVWRAHKPSPDKLRVAIIDSHFTVQKLHDKATVKQIISRLPRYGIVVNESTPKIIRRVCRELDLKICGVPGRPKKRNKTA